MFSGGSDWEDGLISKKKLNRGASGDVCVRRRGVTRIQQPEHSSQYQNQNLYAQYYYKRNRTGRYKSIFGAISKTTPLSERAIWKCTPYGNFLFIFNFTSLTLVLRRGIATAPKQCSPRYSKTRSQGIKLLQVPLSSFLPLTMAKQFRTYHLPQG